MVAAVLCNAIAFIIIFVEVGGYSDVSLYLVSFLFFFFCV